jgi:hypothetical protein
VMLRAASGTYTREAASRRLSLSPGQPTETAASCRRRHWGKLSFAA